MMTTLILENQVLVEQASRGVISEISSHALLMRDYLKLAPTTLPMATRMSQRQLRKRQKQRHKKLRFG